MQGRVQNVQAGEAGSKVTWRPQVLYNGAGLSEYIFFKYHVLLNMGLLINAQW